MSFIDIIAFSSEKVISSESREKYAQIKQYKIVLFALQNCSKRMLVDFDVRGQQGMDI